MNTGRAVVILLQVLTGCNISVQRRCIVNIAYAVITRMAK